MVCFTNRCALRIQIRLPERNWWPRTITDSIVHLLKKKFYNCLRNKNIITFLNNFTLHSLLQILLYNILLL